jgi:hypothetical protein
MDPQRLAPDGVPRGDAIRLARWGFATLFLLVEDRIGHVFAHLPENRESPGDPARRPGDVIAFSHYKLPDELQDPVAWLWSKPGRIFLRGPDDPLLAMPGVAGPVRQELVRIAGRVVAHAFVESGLPVPGDAAVSLRLPTTPPEETSHAHAHLALHILDPAGRRADPDRWNMAQRTAHGILERYVVDRRIHGREDRTQPLPGDDNDDLDVFLLRHWRLPISLRVEPDMDPSVQEIVDIRRELRGLGLLGKAR